MEESRREKKVRKGTGLVHIYCGNGKGKTTTGMGLCIRAAGFGYRVLIYQFMKDNSTSERKVLEKMENITLLEGLVQEKFSFQLTPEEKQERLEFYNNQFRKVTRKAAEEDYDVLFLDETVYTIRAGLLDEALVIDFLRNKPEKLEVILTGQDPSQALMEQADYVSEIRKIKHPFDWKQPARDGIER
ncbi:MAG: cob(I)yrinic acid a,c-diamide adenosyltransferase [Lachnospiraceae bacterium]|nr:cob(I)yrinic acid a,c-diamide adenosyltransferase [Lachnospiraceae bacterium]